MRETHVRIGLVLPDVLGTYSDAGNATVLCKRLEWRDIDATIVPIRLRDDVPSSLDLYLLGGGEDEAQALAAARLRSTPGLHQAAERGAVVVGVCAGLQVLGTRFMSTDGVEHAGLGLLDLETRPGECRAVGEVAAQPNLFDAPLTGFENHRGVTTVGPGSRPLGTVTRGIGNGDGTEGAVTGHVLATYLHGPVLARNPALADLLLTWALGAELSPLDMPEVTELRRERLRGRR
ncbi:MAG TPA: glutamine amidotransferase [Amycolatopsis sp.]|nr:glutamine amidotransferase [Amycolatopsis sp.]